MVQNTHNNEINKNDLIKIENNRFFSLRIHISAMPLLIHVHVRKILSVGITFNTGMQFAPLIRYTTLL